MFLSQCKDTLDEYSIVFLHDSFPSHEDLSEYITCQRLLCNITEMFALTCSRTVSLDCRIKFISNGRLPCSLYTCMALAPLKCT